MKKRFEFFVIATVLFLSSFFVSCYGSYDIFYKGNDVDYRTEKLLPITDSSDSAFAASGLSTLSGKYDVLIITDSHFGSKISSTCVEALYKWLDSVKGSDKAPAFVLSLGDSVDTGAQCEFDEYKQFCDKLKSDYGMKIIFNAAGNHDIYQSHWDLWKDNCYPHTSFYKFQTDSFSWYCFDTASGTLGEQQYYKIRQEIASDPRPKIIFSHYPLTEFNIAFGLSDTTERNLLISDFAQNNVKCYFGGHNHYYRYNYLKLHNYCCASFRYDNEVTILHVDETQGTAMAEPLKLKD